MWEACRHHDCLQSYKWEELFFPRTSQELVDQIHLQSVLGISKLFSETQPAVLAESQYMLLCWKTFNDYVRNCEPKIHLARGLHHYYCSKTRDKHLPDGSIAISWTEAHLLNTGKKCSWKPISAYLTLLLLLLTSHVERRWTPTDLMHMEMLTRKYAIVQLSQNLIQFLTITDIDLT